MRGQLFPGGSANVVLAGPGVVAHLPDRAWHLSDWRHQQANEQGVALAEGFSSFQEPRVMHQWFRPAQMHGAIWLGMVADPRSFQLPVTMHATSTVAFERVRDAFFEDLGHEHTARLYVNSPSGTTWLDIRMDGQPEVSQVRFDDAITQEQDYLIPVISEQSHWQAPEVTRRFIDGRGWDPSSQVWNFGDLEEWPMWVLRGPGVFSLPDLDSLLTVTVSAGETVAITGDPDRPLAVSDMDPNAHRRLGGQRPQKVIAGHEHWDARDLKVVGGIPGVTSAVVQIDPRRRRPW